MSCSLINNKISRSTLFNRNRMFTPQRSSNPRLFAAASQWACKSFYSCFKISADIDKPLQRAFIQLKWEVILYSVYRHKSNNKRELYQK